MIYRLVLVAAIVGIAWIGWTAFRGTPASSGSGSEAWNELRALANGRGTRGEAPGVLQKLERFATTTGESTTIDGRLGQLHRGEGNVSSKEGLERRAEEAGLWDLYRRAFAMRALGPMLGEASARLDGAKSFENAAEFESFRDAAHTELSLIMGEHGGGEPPARIDALCAYMKRGAEAVDAAAWDRLAAQYRALYLACYGGVGTASLADYPTAPGADGWSGIGLEHAVFENVPVDDAQVAVAAERISRRLGTMNAGWERAWTPESPQWTLATLRGSGGKVEPALSSISDWWFVYGMDHAYVDAERRLREHDATLGALAVNPEVMSKWDATASGWIAAFQRLHAAYVHLSSKAAAGVSGRPGEARAALQRDWSSVYVELEDRARKTERESWLKGVAAGRADIEERWIAFEGEWKRVLEPANPRTPQPDHAIATRAGSSESPVRLLTLQCNAHHDNRQSMAFLIAQSIDPFSGEVLSSVGWKGAGPWADVLDGASLKLVESGEPRALLGGKVRALQQLATAQVAGTGLLAVGLNESGAREAASRVAMTRALTKLANVNDLGIAEAAKRGAPSEKDRFDNSAIDPRYGRGALPRAVGYAEQLAAWSVEASASVPPFGSEAGTGVRAKADQAAAAYVSAWYTYWTRAYGTGLRSIAVESAKQPGAAEAFTRAVGEDAGDRLSLHTLRGLAAFQEMRATKAPVVLEVTSRNLADASREFAAFAEGPALKIVDEGAGPEVTLSGETGEIGRLRTMTRAFTTQLAAIGAAKDSRLWQSENPAAASALRESISYFAFTPAQGSSATVEDLRPGFGPLSLVGAAVRGQLGEAVDTEVKREYALALGSIDASEFPLRAPGTGATPAGGGNSGEVRSLLARVEGFAEKHPTVFPRVRASERDASGRAVLSRGVSGESMAAKVPQDVRDFVESCRDWAEFLRAADGRDGAAFSASVVLRGGDDDVAGDVHYVEIGFDARPSFVITRAIPRAPSAVRGLTWNPTRDTHAWLFATQGRVVDNRVSFLASDGTPPEGASPHFAGSLAFPEFIHAYRAQGDDWVVYEDIGASIAAGAMGEGDGRQATGEQPSQEPTTSARVASLVELVVPAIARDKTGPRRSVETERRGTVAIRLRFEGPAFPKYLPGAAPAWE